ncbi:hypothetical protein BDN72DRAFT_881840 [Pluteus cervinus]|uniref:Uncharacterized protein n=1 Tax=Pluteus cervinus TaxID=181527 RepID=A0ACD3ADE2_9AGAR|nr:hypothetical protein BDN72DRAFT_881840 [Pluteus cervinus]
MAHTAGPILPKFDEEEDVKPKIAPDSLDNLPQYHRRQAELDRENAKWNPQTVIALAYRNNVSVVKMKDQTALIQSILHKSIEIGFGFMVFGLPETRRLPTYQNVSAVTPPMSSESLSHIAYLALLEAADRLGYGGPLNILERLREGETSTYKRPLTDLVADRLKKRRTTMKQSIASHIRQLVPFPISKTTELLTFSQRGNYTFPRKPDGKYNYKKPFAVKVIWNAVSFAFFDGEGAITPSDAVLKYFVSSDPNVPREREVPAEMVAMASTMLHGILQEHVSTHGSLPYTSATDSIYRGHIQILTRLRLNEPKFYHTLMHQIFCYATTEYEAWSQLLRAHDEMMDQVDWDNMASDPGSKCGDENEEQGN